MVNNRLPLVYETSMDIQEALDKYLKYKSVKHERASNIYGIPLRRFFEETKKKEIEEVTNDDIISFQISLKSRYEDSSQSLYASALRGFFTFTNNRGWTKIAIDEISLPHVIEKIPAYVVQSEFETLCDTAGDSLRDLCILHVLWYTGVRNSELCDMNVESLDLKDWCAKVQTKKSFRHRHVYWGEETNSLLIQYVGDRTGPVFMTDMGRISTRQIQRIVDTLKRKAGIRKPITPHSFRHGFVHENLNIGTDLPAIQAMAGHIHPESIFKYTKRLDEDIKDKGRESIRKRTALIKLKKYANA